MFGRRHVLFLNVNDLWFSWSYAALLKQKFIFSKLKLAIKFKCEEAEKLTK